MGCNIIKIFIFIYITTTYCLSEIEKFKYNNLSYLSDSDKFKRNVKVYNNLNNLYDKNITLDKENKKRSINNTNDKIFRKKRMIIGDFFAKWFTPIPYYIGVGVRHHLVESALSMIQREACIRFKKYRRMLPKVSGIGYLPGDNCSSPVGQQRGKIWQIIFLSPSCDKIGRIQHETLHSLGFYHTHSRFDRSRYLYINKKNVKKGFYSDFMKVRSCDSRTFDVPFDFGSVMMYSPIAFSENGQDTILSHDFRYKNTYGVADRISFADAKMLNKFYCPYNCRRKINCFNGGYQDPNNCNKCKCVQGYIGPFCNILSLPGEFCGPSKLQALSKIKKFKLDGKKNCIFHVFSPNNQKIAIKILASRFNPNFERPCRTFNSLEIKYWANKVPTGARFCRSLINVIIYSENNHIIIYYRSNNSRNYFEILYKTILKNFNEDKVEDDFEAYNNLAE